MQYFVIWTDGQKFGPADLATLNEWAAQGRINPTTELESVVDGSRIVAGSLAGLNFGGAAAPVVETPAYDPTPQETMAAQAEVQAVSASVGGGDQFFVVGADGAKYGPADAATLSQWAADSRVTPNTEVENAATGARLTAGMIPGIIFPTSAAAAANPMTSMGSGSMIGSGSAVSNYPREGFGSGATEEDLKKFNWGAFFLNWIWGLNHKYPMALIALGLGILSNIPLIGLLFAVGQIGFCVWLGMQGNRVAWESGRFSTVEEMHKCQKIWATWGLGLLIMGCVCAIGVGIMAISSGAMQNLSR
jgi:hypothetical protein